MTPNKNSMRYLKKERKPRFNTILPNKFMFQYKEEWDPDVNEK